MSIYNIYIISQGNTYSAYVIQFYEYFKFGWGLKHLEHIRYLVPQFMNIHENVHPLGTDKAVVKSIKIEDKIHIN